MKRFFRSLSSAWAWLLQPLLVLVILAVGFFAASRLSLRREPPQRSASVVYAPLVRTTSAAPSAEPVVVRGHGSLAARTRIDLVPQVGGELIEVHPELRAGGRFRAGEVLARVEPRDYELAVARAEAEVQSAETVLVTIRAEAEAAVAEWDALNPGEEPPPLVSREPQVREAEARADAARAELERARLDLARTRLALPFDGRVVAASVDTGAVVAPNQSLGVVYATDLFEAAVPLRLEELRWLDLPADGSDAYEAAVGSPALVRGATAAGAFEAPGRIVRVAGELDPRSRMARVVVEVAAADLAAEVARQLVPGTFVDVHFEGRRLDDAVALPRAALREDGVVWVVEDGRLVFSRPTVVYRGDGTVRVRGLAPGAVVVVSNLEVVTDGMQVRVLGEEPRGDGEGVGR